MKVLFHPTGAGVEDAYSCEVTEEHWERIQAAVARGAQVSLEIDGERVPGTVTPEQEKSGPCGVFVSNPPSAPST
jgi:hypothetical protein